MKVTINENDSSCEVLMKYNTNLNRLNGYFIFLFHSELNENKMEKETSTSDLRRLSFENKDFSSTIVQLEQELKNKQKELQHSTKKCADFKK